MPLTSPNNVDNKSSVRLCVFSELAGENFPDGSYLSFNYTIYAGKNGQVTSSLMCGCTS